MNKQTVQNACVAAAAGALLFILPINTRATNTVPFADSFETYNLGDTFTNSSAWTAGSVEAAVVTTLYYRADSTYSNSYNGINLKPIPAADHGASSKVLRLDGGVSNAVSSEAGQIYWVDMLLQPTRWTEDTRPSVPSDTHCAFYFNSNGVLALNFFPDVSATPPSSVWVDVTSDPLPSNAWTRITLMLDYANSDIVYQMKYFQIYVNGVAVSNAFGYSQNTGFNSTPDGGVFFAMGNASATNIQEIAFRNSGVLDDFVITTNTLFSGIKHTVTATAGPNGSISPSGAVQVGDGFDQLFLFSPVSGASVSNIVVDGVTNNTSATDYTMTNIVADHTIYVTFTAPPAIATSNGVPFSWLAGYGLTTDQEAAASANQDGDKSDTTTEYYFGTDPTNRASDASIVKNWVTNGVEIIGWQGGTNGSSLPFQIFCTTNASGGGTWTNIGTTAHSPSGLNFWTNALPVKGAFYEIRVITSP